jgi:cell division protein ZapA
MRKKDQKSTHWEGGMAIVHIRVNGREYDVACDDGQEEHLRLLADEVDDRVRALAFGMGNPAENMALLLTALMMADEAIENKKEIQSIAAEVEHLRANMVEDKKTGQDDRMAEIEGAMAITLEEIAARIEKIAAQMEVG